MVYILYHIINFSRLITILDKALDAIYNQVIRYNLFMGVFNEAYNNELVRFNT
jgi:hypothetical protein